MSRETRVAMTGATSLLGKEILGVLKERRFPASRVVRLEAGEDFPEIPVLDLDAEALPLAPGEPESERYDLVLLAANPRAGRGKAPHFEQSSEWVIDAVHVLPEPEGAVLSIPFLDRPNKTSAGNPHYFISPHTAAIVLDALLVRLSACFELKRVVAQIFNPASELGPEAIDELQKQTVSLLSFQQVPKEIFDAQSAFNLAPRLGRKARAGFASLELRIRSELKRMLAGRVPLPSVRLVQVPLFYSLAFSLYVEAAGPVTAATAEQALACEQIRVLKSSHGVPSPVEVQGSAEVLVDPVLLDEEHEGGFWLWAVADNLRVAAENAVAIAESLLAGSEGT